ncbi:MAG: hypothetical protein R6W90_07525 [Ignavibacteriaceae bacterium]
MIPFSSLYAPALAHEPALTLALELALELALIVPFSVHEQTIIIYTRFNQNYHFMLNL